MNLNDPDTLEEQILADEKRHRWNMESVTVDRYMSENYERLPFGDYRVFLLKGRY